MNRRNFLAKLGIGVAAIAVAPQILSQPAPIEVGPKEILAMQDSMMNAIVNMKPSRTPLDTIINHIEGRGWYSDQEALARAEMQKRIEWSIMFGERKEANRKFYSGGIWTTS